jgi:DNA polymerase-3 subunit beta
LDNFLFELDNNELTVSASDLETTMSANLAIDSTSKGSVAVPAKLLLEILKTFPEQPLTLPLKKTARWKSVQTLVNMLWLCSW